MNQEDLAKLINDKSELFLRKLKHAGLNELEYWEKRPENLPKEMFVRYLQGLDESKVLYPNMEERDSGNGKYVETGYKWVFKFEDDFVVMGVSIRVYVKGFFFEIEDPRGVEIQSFKRATPKLVVVS